MATSVSIDALRPEIWQKELYKNVIDNLYFNKFMGEGENNIVQIKNDLKKQPGDTVTIPLTAKLSGDGVVGKAELEGNEEAISVHSDQISIDQIRNAVRLDGKLDEQKNVYNMRQDGKNKLSMWLQEFIERQIFLKLAGVNNTTLTDVGDSVIGGNATWSNSPNRVSGTDTAAGFGDRYLCADFTNGADSLAATDLLTPELISRARIKAGQRLSSGHPRVNPIKIDGINHYILFIHPWQAFDLKNNATYAQAQRDAASRGSDNPIFTGALGMWDNVIVHEHEYVPFLDVASGASGDQDNFFEAAGSSTDFAVDAFRAVLCGQQACVLLQTSDSMKMVEETFDYQDKVGYATGLIGGIQKVTFNSIDYGVVAIDTAATALV